MKTAIMQPYFMPYIGYWQLINAVDNFVLLDDVNFIMRGWINRNNILLNNKSHLFSFPLEKPSQNKLICETRLAFDKKNRESFLNTLQLAYKKAPQYSKIFPLIEEIVNFKENDLTKFILNSFIKTFSYLAIEKNFLISSQIEKDNSLKGEERIIEICKKLGAKTYINLPGGRKLYSGENFQKQAIELKFISPDIATIIYSQFGENFVPALSFLDIMMFNDKEKIKYFLEEYSLSD